jgi:hypothetical protein
MAVTLTGSNGLFTRLGKLFQIAVQIKSAQGTIATEIQDALNEFDVGDNDHSLSLTGIKEATQMSMASVYSNIRTVAQKTLIEMVHDDDPLPSRTLNAAMDRLIKQMEDASASINASAYTASVAADSGNAGNGEIIATTNANLLTTANTRAESVVFKCTKDSQVTGTVGREIFSIQGEMARTDIRDYLWPGGSGASTSVIVTDPSVDSTDQLGKNLLTNSDFNDFTTNTPDNWTIATGSAGTQVFKNTTKGYIFAAEEGEAEASLLFTGASAVTTKITQTLDTSGQTTGILRPDTVYVMSYKMYIPSTVAAGVFKVRILDAGSGVVGISAMKAEIGSVTMAGVSAGSWTTRSAFFKTPEALPTNTPYKFTLEFSTAPTNGADIYIDEVCLFRAHQIGNGPYFGLLRGSANFVKDDEFVMTVAKSGTGTMQEYFDKFFRMYGSQKQLPENSAGGETVADSLIA